MKKLILKNIVNLVLNWKKNIPLNPQHCQHDWEHFLNKNSENNDNEIPTENKEKDFMMYNNKYYSANDFLSLTFQNALNEPLPREKSEQIFKEFKELTENTFEMEMCGSEEAKKTK